MIKNRKTTLENRNRISKLESTLSNFKSLSDSLRESQDEISDVTSNLYFKYRRLVLARPSVGLEYEIPEEAFTALSEASTALRNAVDFIKDARRILDEN